MLGRSSNAWAYNGLMSINRRKAMGLLAVAGAGVGAVTAQVSATSPRTADQELQIARQGRLRDAQRVAMVKLPQNVEPAFRFRA